jgi:hypothetical protein
MSKKKNRQFNQASSYSTPAAGSGDLAAEYKIIKFDLIRVLIMNLIFLAAVLVLYYTNLHSGYLERWFEKLLHF